MRIPASMVAMLLLTLPPVSAQLQSVRGEGGNHLFQKLEDGERHLEIENKDDGTAILTVSMGNGFEKTLDLPNGDDVRPYEFDLSFEYSGNFYAILVSRYTAYIVNLKDGSLSNEISVEALTEDYMGTDAQSGTILSIRVTPKGLEFVIRDYADEEPVALPFDELMKQFKP